MYGVPFASSEFDLYYAAFIALLNVKAWYSVIMTHVNCLAHVNMDHQIFYFSISKYGILSCTRQMDHSVPLYWKYAWLDHRYDTLCHINVEYFISNCVVLRSRYSYRLLLEIIILKSHNVLKFCDSNNVINLTYLGLSPIVKKGNNSDWLQWLHFKVEMWSWIFRPVRLVANINQCVELVKNIIIV